MGDNNYVIPKTPHDSDQILSVIGDEAQAGARATHFLKSGQITRCGMNVCHIMIH